MSFKLDKKFLKTSHYLTELKLCTIRLNNNSKFPWIILIPKRSKITDISDLNFKDQTLLMKEIVYASKVMKKLFKTLPVLLIAGALSVSCGKSNSSGGGSSSTTTPVSGLPGSTVTQTSAYSSIEQIRTAFNNKSLSDGLNNGSEIYHMGSFFTGSYASGGINFQAGFCIQLFGWSAGDCEGNNQGDLLLQRLDNGVLKKVTSASATAVTFQEPTGVSDASGYWNYVYTNAQTQTFDRNSGQYREMLGLDIPAQNIINSYVSSAQIQLSNGQKIAGQVLEIVTGYNYGNGQNYIQEVKRFVLSTNLPIIANPVATITGVFQAYNGYVATANGYLGYVGNNTAASAIQSIQISTLHVPSYNGQLQTVQNVTVGF